MLPVSAPFHSALMQPAAAVMAEALAAVEIAAPEVPLIANVRAEPVTEPGAIRRLLVEQVTGARALARIRRVLSGAGVTEFWEIGAARPVGDDPAHLEGCGGEAISARLRISRR